MKIFCILKNNDEAANDDLNWHMLPDSSVLRSDNPFFVPDFDTDFKIYPAIAVRIGRLGKSVAFRFAHRYYSEATISVTVRAENLLAEIRGKVLPWDRAVSFDKSCMIGNFMPIDRLCDNENVIINIDGRRIEIDTSNLRSDIDSIIAAISENNILKIGDVVLIPVTGADGISLTPGMELKAYTDNEKLLEIRIK